MALKDLLVHVDRTPAALRRLRLAADLGRRHGSRLTALYILEADSIQLHQRSSAEFGLVAAADMALNSRRAAQADAQIAQDLAHEVAAVRQEFGLEVELLSVKGIASVVVAQQARFADLCIVGQDSRSDAMPAGHAFFEAVLVSSGRPALIVPPSGSCATLGRHILIGWNSSRASARALNDALSLIERAERSTVLTINPVEYIDRSEPLAPEQIVEHLRRHGACAEGVRRENADSGSIADTLQEEAHRRGADMIVAGAFGHLKFWEKLMGGVTCELLARMTLPILMSY